MISSVCINLFSFGMKRTFLYISNLISIKWLETLNQTNFEKNQIKAQRFRLIWEKINLLKFVIKWKIKLEDFINNFIILFYPPSNVKYPIPQNGRTLTNGELEQTKHRKFKLHQQLWANLFQTIEIKSESYWLTLSFED